MHRGHSRTRAMSPLSALAAGERWGIHGPGACGHLASYALQTGVVLPPHHELEQQRQQRQQQQQQQDVPAEVQPAARAQQQQQQQQQQWAQEIRLPMRDIKKLVRGGAAAAVGVVAQQAAQWGGSGAGLQQQQQQLQWDEEEEARRRQRTRPNIVLTKQIMASRTWEEAYALFLEFSDVFNAVNTAALISHISKLVHARRVCLGGACGRCCLPTWGAGRRRDSTSLRPRVGGGGWWGPLCLPLWSP